MIRKAAGPLGQYWKDLPPWVKSGPLGVVFFLVVWAAALLFIDFRVNQRQAAEDARNAMLRQSAAIQSLADDRREQTRLLAELVELLKRPGNEKWGELSTLVQQMGDRYGDDEMQRAVRNWQKVHEEANRGSRSRLAEPETSDP